MQSKTSADSLKLNEQQREGLLKLTIQDSKAYFPQGVNPEFCGFEGKGQHVQKYQDIQAQNPDSFVVLAAGADLQIRMSDWKTQKQFFAFIQNRGKDRGISGPNRIVLEESREFSHVSSTEIRKAVLEGRQPVGIGPLAANYLKQLVPLPFRFQEIQTRFPVYEDLRAEIARRFPVLECRSTDLHVTPNPGSQDFVVPIAILEPRLTPKLENLPKVFNLANTISINRSYPNPKDDIPFQVNKKNYTCYRPNHNGTHSYRQVRYLEVLLDFISKNGRQEAKTFCEKLTEEQQVNLRLAAFFLRAGRADESSGPETRDQMKLRSFELYQHYASGMGINPQIIEDTRDLILHSCNPNKMLEYKDKSHWNPKAFLQTLLTLAHEIDLVRCFPNFEQRTKPSLVENLSGWVLDAKTDAEIVAASLQKFGIDANTLVGQQVAVNKNPYDLPRFFVHSTYGEYCRYRLSKLEFSINPSSSSSTAKKGSCILM